MKNIEEYLKEYVNRIDLEIERLKLEQDRETEEILRRLQNLKYFTISLLSDPSLSRQERKNIYNQEVTNINNDTKRLYRFDYIITELKMKRDHLITLYHANNDIVF
jgi:hypothetical protein